MLPEKVKAEAFIQKYNMGYQNLNVQKAVHIFISEMEKGLCNHPSSLKMIPTYVKIPPKLTVGKPVIVLDAGGTHLRVAVVTMDPRKGPLIEHYKVFDMPGVDSEIASGEFFDWIVRYMEPVIEKSDSIAFCFSYASTPLDNYDAVSVELGKQIKISGLIGEKIGSRLNEALKKRSHYEKKKIVVINDSVAALLGGMASFPESRYDSYIGFILGTGTNTCYIEEQKYIMKIQSREPEGSMLVNLESGEYMRFDPGDIDKEFYRQFEEHDKCMFEKMVSGVYMGGLIRETIKKAAGDGLFSEEFSRRFSLLNSLESYEVDAFLDTPLGDNKLSGCCGDATESGDSDRRMLFFLIDQIYERAARLIVINFGSILLKIGKGSDPLHPVCIIAEGSTFHKSNLLRAKIRGNIRDILNNQLGVYCDLVEVENVALIGAAIAGMSV